MIRKKLRILSAIVAASFLLQDLSFAAIDIKPSEISLFPKAIPSIELPKSVAVVGDGYRANSRFRGNDKARGNDKTFILVQDAHTNESAQMNIARSLKTIIEKEKIRFVFLEAADGNNSLALVRDKAPEKKRQQVAREYLRKGILDGSEYLDITADPTLDFIPWGVENKELYWQSLKAYEKVAKGRERFHAYLNEVARAIETLKPRIFGPSLQEFDARRQDFIKEKMPLTDYIDVLMQQMKFKNSAVTHYPHLLALSKLKDKEKAIDFNKANEEQVDAMASLSAEDQEILQEAAVGGKDAPFKLSMQDHKTQKAFYALLEEKIGEQRTENREQNVIPAEAGIHAGSRSKHSGTTVFPELSKYFEYLKEAEKISPKDILEEQKLLEEEIYTLLTKTEDERALHRADEAQRFLVKLFNLTVTPDEFRAYKKDKESYSVTNITGFLNRKIMDLRDFYERVTFLKDDYEDYVRSAEEFYRLTYERDMAFLDNSIAMMDKVGDTKAILVTGGYHTPNLMNLLKDKSLSYIVVTPQVLHETNLKKYESLLLSQKEEGVDINPKKFKTIDYRPQTTSKKASVKADKLDLLAAGQKPTLINPILGQISTTLGWQGLASFRRDQEVGGYHVGTSGSRLSSSAAPNAPSKRFRPDFANMVAGVHKAFSSRPRSVIQNLRQGEGVSADGARLTKSAVPAKSEDRFRRRARQTAVFGAPKVITDDNGQFMLALGTNRYTTDDITAGVLNRYLSERGISAVRFESPTNPKVIYAVPATQNPQLVQGGQPSWDLTDLEGLDFTLRSLANYISDVVAPSGKPRSNKGELIQGDFGQASGNGARLSFVFVNSARPKNADALDSLPRSASVLQVINALGVNPEEVNTITIKPIMPVGKNGGIQFTYPKDRVFGNSYTLNPKMSKIEITTAAPQATMVNGATDIFSDLDRETSRGDYKAAIEIVLASDLTRKNLFRPVINGAQFDEIAKAKAVLDRGEKLYQDTKNRVKKALSDISAAAKMRQKNVQSGFVASFEERLIGLHVSARRIVNKVITNRFVDFYVSKDSWSSFIRNAWDPQTSEINAEVREALLEFVETFIRAKDNFGEDDFHGYRSIHGKATDEDITTLMRLTRNAFTEIAHMVSLMPQDKVAQLSSGHVDFKPTVDRIRGETVKVNESVVNRDRRQTSRETIAEKQVIVKDQAQKWFDVGIVPTFRWMKQYAPDFYAQYFTSSGDKAYSTEEAFFKAAKIPSKFVNSVVRKKGDVAYIPDGQTVKIIEAINPADLAFDIAREKYPSIYIRIQEMFGSWRQGIMYIYHSKADGKKPDLKGIVLGQDAEDGFQHETKIQVADLNRMLNEGRVAYISRSKTVSVSLDDFVGSILWARYALVEGDNFERYVEFPINSIDDLRAFLAEAGDNGKNPGALVSIIFKEGSRLSVADPRIAVGGSRLAEPKRAGRVASALTAAALMAGAASPSVTARSNVDATNPGVEISGAMAPTELMAQSAASQIPTVSEADLGALVLGLTFHDRYGDGPNQDWFSLYSKYDPRDKMFSQDKALAEMLKHPNNFLDMTISPPAGKFDDFIAFRVIIKNDKFQEVVRIDGKKNEGRDYERGLPDWYVYKIVWSDGSYDRLNQSTPTQPPIPVTLARTSESLVISFGQIQALGQFIGSPIGQMDAQIGKQLGNKESMKGAAVELQVRSRKGPIGARLSVASSPAAINSRAWAETKRRVLPLMGDIRDEFEPIARGEYAGQIQETDGNLGTVEDLLRMNEITRLQLDRAIAQLAEIRAWFDRNSPKTDLADKTGRVLNLLNQLVAQSEIAAEENEDLIRLRDARTEARRGAAGTSTSFEIPLGTPLQYYQFIRSGVRPGAVVSIEFTDDEGAPRNVNRVILKQATEATLFYFFDGDKKREENIPAVRIQSVTIHAPTSGARLASQVTTSPEVAPTSEPPTPNFRGARLATTSVSLADIPDAMVFTFDGKVLSVTGSEVTNNPATFDTDTIANGRVFTIGRPHGEIKPDIQLSTVSLSGLRPSLSRQHAEIRWQDGRWEIRDAGSANGTAIEGKALGQDFIPLFPGMETHKKDLLEAKDSKSIVTVVYTSRLPISASDKEMSENVVAGQVMSVVEGQVSLRSTSNNIVSIPLALVQSVQVVSTSDDAESQRWLLDWSKRGASVGGQALLGARLATQNQLTRAQEDALAKVESVYGKSVSRYIRVALLYFARPEKSDFEESESQYVAQKRDGEGFPKTVVSGIVGDSERINLAKTARVEVMSLDGGLGEKLRRTVWKTWLYTKGYLAVNEAILDSQNQAKLGAKGTDMGVFIKIDGQVRYISVSESKLLQFYYQGRDKKFASLSFRPIVNVDSEPSYKVLVDKPNVLGIKAAGDTRVMTYRELLNSVGVEIKDFFFQQDVPGLEEITDRDQTVLIPGQTLDAHHQSGGHGQIGIEIVVNPEEVELPSDGLPSILAFTNGDNQIASNISPEIVGDILKNNIAIGNLVTAATRVDRKGGKYIVRLIRFMGLEKWISGQRELAAAKEMGKQAEEDFYAAGQKEGEEKFGLGSAGQQPFNTNNFYINITRLIPFLRELKQVLGSDRYLAEVISPNFMRKDKKKAKDGREYYPVDSAIGNVFHNINEFVLKVVLAAPLVDAALQRAALARTRTENQLIAEFGDALAVIRKHNLDNVIHYYDVPSRMFTPQKNPWDALRQMLGGYYRFNLDEANLEEVDESLDPSEVTILDNAGNSQESGKGYYSEFMNLLKTFVSGDSVESILASPFDIRQLDELEIRGNILIQDTVFAGIVRIVNEDQSEKIFDLRSAIINNASLKQVLGYEDGGVLVLKNVEISINASGQVNIRPITSGARMADAQVITSPVTRTPVAAPNSELLTPNSRGARMAPAQSTSASGTRTPVGMADRNKLLSQARPFRGAEGSRLVGLEETPDVVADLDKDGGLSVFVERVGDTRGARFALILDAVRLFTISVAAVGLMLNPIGAKDAQAAYTVPFKASSKIEVSSVTKAVASDPNISIADIATGARLSVMNVEALDLPSATVPTLLEWPLGSVAKLSERNPEIFSEHLLSIVAGGRLAQRRNPHIRFGFSSNGVPENLMELGARLAQKEGALIDAADAFEGIVVQVTDIDNPRGSRLGNAIAMPVDMRGAPDALMDTLAFSLLMDGLAGSVRSALDRENNAFNVQAIKDLVFPPNLVSYLRLRSADPSLSFTGSDVLKAIFDLDRVAMRKVAFKLPGAEKLGTYFTRALKAVRAFASAA